MAVVALLCLAQFVVVLDVTIVAVALPAIQDDLGFSSAGLQWVITGYTICFAALLTASGRAADLLGRRRFFAFGLALFSAASLGCGLAGDATVLVAMRALQGAGAAALSAAALALLSAAYSEGGAREHAVAAWTAAASGGGASGWMLGGLLTAELGWEWVFFVNVPIGAAALVATPWLVRESRDAGASQRLDLPGAAALALGLGALVLGLTSIERHGLASAAALLPLTAALVLLALFWLRERTARDPLLSLEDLRRPGFTPAFATAAFLTATTSSAMFLALLLQQRVLGFSPVEAGFGSAPLNLAVIAGSAAGPAIARRVGPGRSMSAGLGLVALAALLLATADAASGYPQLGAAFVLMGLGLGFASVASTALGTAALAPERQGLAAGLLGTAAQLGTVIGLATLVPLAAARAQAIGDLAGGYSWGQLGAAATALLAAIGLLLATRARGYTRSRPQLPLHGTEDA